METKDMGRCQILLIDDDEDSLKELQEIVSEIGCRCLCATDSAGGLAIIQEQKPEMIIADACVVEKDGVDITEAIHKIYPTLPVIMIAAPTSKQKVIQLLNAGAYDYIEKPFCSDKVNHLIKNALHTVFLFEEVNYLRCRFNQEYNVDQIMSRSPNMQHAFEKILKVAPTSCNVLITGENGTGKDLVANTIHNYSHVREKRFLPINCSAIPAQLIESELFGHVKGAFTGAVSNEIGLVQAAHGGTLFLDEIGDLPLELQPKILRLMETKEIQKVGSNETETVDIRIISATNQDLKAKILEGTFRQDLYYRLHTVEISLPPLRDRKSEITPLALNFLKRYNKSFNKNIKSVSPEVLEMFQNYNWPGNVRELKNAIEHACVFCESEIIKPQDLPEDILLGKSEKPQSFKLDDRVAAFEKRYIESVLKDHNHDIKAACKQLDISPATLYRKLKDPAKLRIFEMESDISKKVKHEKHPSL